MLYGNIVDLGDDQIEVGLEVEVVFDDVTDSITLPRFRTVGAPVGPSRLESHVVAILRGRSVRASSP